VVVVAGAEVAQRCFACNSAHPAEEDGVRVGTRIEEARQRRGASYREAGTDLGVDASAVLRWTSGLTLPGRNRLAAIADWCGVSFEVLLDEWRTDTADKRQGISLAAPASADLDTVLQEVRDLREALEAALDRFEH
jgi:transcriptional regulator with XRE-family HTH domain